MSTAEQFVLHDVQSQPDHRRLRIDAVGVAGLRHPVIVESGARAMPTIATFSMAVGLGAGVKGTHMSRFVALLEAQTRPLNMRRFRRMVVDMLARLAATDGEIAMRFPYFMEKAAPVSGVRSLLDYEVCWEGRVSGDGEHSFRMHVTVPVTSLCPCSKQISQYGAHNQRSHIAIRAELLADMPIDDLIGIAERNASCEVYGLLKRPDEKYVTERAYDNPKFAEDLVRDVALALNRDTRIARYSVEVENFESIHNHSAFARISRGQI